MWFVHLVCVPFKIVVFLYNTIKVIITGCKVVAPHISKGMDSATEALREFDQNLQRWNNEQSQADEQKRVADEIVANINKARSIKLAELNAELRKAEKEHNDAK